MIVRDHLAVGMASFRDRAFVLLFGLFLALPVALGFGDTGPGGNIASLTVSSFQHRQNALRSLHGIFLFSKANILP